MQSAIASSYRLALPARRCGRRGSRVPLARQLAAALRRAISEGPDGQHIDGFVLARSAFRHSLNYRAVMVFGAAAIIEDEHELGHFAEGGDLSKIPLAMARRETE